MLNCCRHSPLSFVRSHRRRRRQRQRWSHSTVVQLPMYPHSNSHAKTVVFVVVCYRLRFLVTALLRWSQQMYSSQTMLAAFFPFEPIDGGGQRWRTHISVKRFMGLFSFLLSSALLLVFLCSLFGQYQSGIVYWTLNRILIHWPKDHNSISYFFSVRLRLFSFHQLLLYFISSFFFFWYDFVQ